MSTRMHEYLRRLLLAQQNGLLDAASASVAEVQHDNWCGIYLGKNCGCDPHISIKCSNGTVEIDRNGFLVPKKKELP